MNVSRCLVAIIVLIPVSCSGPTKNTAPTRPDSVNRTAEAARPAVPEPDSPKRQLLMQAETAPSAGTWVYTETVGEGATKAYAASVTSPNILTFEKPFDGGATATLTVRRRNGSTTVSLSVSTGQFTTSFQGGQVRIRFDNGPSVLYTFSAAANGSTDIIFLEPVPPFIQKLKTAKKMVINAGFYGQGTRRIEFKTAGFRWKR